jgi:hypothetical protein
MILLLYTTSQNTIHFNSVLFFFKSIFFKILISSFNIWFVRDCASWFILIFFLWSFQSYNLGCKFGKVTRVFFFNFFNFIFQYFIDLKLGFIIYFALTFMRLFRSYNPSCRLDGLTQVGPSCFSCPFFKLVFLFRFHWINCKLCFIIYFVCFVRGYLILITQVAGLVS